MPQVKFRLDYSGGYGSFGSGYWKQIVKHNVCGPYTGPPLRWKVVACTTKSGENWALQSWQRGLPNSGFKPHSSLQSAHELHVSHWTGPLPVLWLKWDWVYGGRYDHLYGKFSYRDGAVHGFGNNGVGNPTDSYGRNIYVDTLDPPAWTTGYSAGRRLDALQRLPRPQPARELLRRRLPEHVRPRPGRGRERLPGDRDGPGRDADRVRGRAPAPAATSRAASPPRGDGGPPNYNSIPAGPLGKLLAYPYSRANDQQFTQEEQAVAGAGDSCFKSAGTERAGRPRRTDHEAAARDVEQAAGDERRLAPRAATRSGRHLVRRGGTGASGWLRRPRPAWPGRSGARRSCRSGSSPAARRSRARPRGATSLASPTVRVSTAAFDAA